LERLVGKRLTDEVLEDVLVRLGISPEGFDDDKVTVETLANRPDYLSETGIARSIACMLGVRKGLRSYEARKPQFKVVVQKSVGKVRPKTACAVVTGITFTDEKIKEVVQMQEKLHQTYCRNRRKAAIGVYPLEKIAWPVSYEARVPSEIRFTPLESSREMTATQILSTHPAGQDYGNLLQGLDKFPIFIDANNNVLSMPPIINSEMTGRVTPGTTDVFIECSGFDQGVLDKLLNIIVCSLADEGGTIHSVDVEYGASKRITPDLKNASVPFSIDDVNRRLGLSLKETEVKQALAKVGIGYSARKAIVPPYRVDILHAVDIAEEIMLAVGMDNIQPLPSPVSLVAVADRCQEFKSRVASLLVGLGLLEISTYHLDSLENQTSRTNLKKPVIQLINKTNKEYSVLRASMVPSLLNVLRANKHRDYPQKIFCVGTVFGKDPKADTGISETSSLGIAISHMRADYTDARQHVEYLLRLLGIGFTLSEAEDAWAIEGRVAVLSVGKRPIATLGEVHPQVMQNWGLDMPTVVVELDLDALFDAVNER
jgi:phenylalanyl-tRNA synthetase beta chain